MGLEKKIPVPAKKADTGITYLIHTDPPFTTQWVFYFYQAGLLTSGSYTSVAPSQPFY